MQLKIYMLLKVLLPGKISLSDAECSWSQYQFWIFSNEHLSLLFHMLLPQEKYSLNPWCAEDDFSGSHYLAHIHQIVYNFHSSRLKSSLVVQTSGSLHLGSLYMIMVNYLENTIFLGSTIQTSLWPKWVWHINVCVCVCVVHVCVQV